MPIERKEIEKKYLLLCEGKDAENFLITYLNSSALSQDQRFSNDIQVLDFGGNENLGNFLMNLKNMENYDLVTSLAIVRDAEKDYNKACHEICSSLMKCGIESSEEGVWFENNSGLKCGFVLFPLDNSAGTLEDLCLRILAEKDNKSILGSVEGFLFTMESVYGRCYHRKHKNMLYTYLSSSDKYVTMPLGTASRAGAFDWSSDILLPLKDFLCKGFA